jgi:hypothetical protein
VVRPKCDDITQSDYTKNVLSGHEKESIDTIKILLFGFNFQLLVISLPYSLHLSSSNSAACDDLGRLILSSKAAALAFASLLRSSNIRMDGGLVLRVTSKNFLLG